MPIFALVIALTLCHSVQGTTPGNFFGVRYGKKYDKVLETHNGVSDPFSCVTLCVKVFFKALVARLRSEEKSETIIQLLLKLL